MDARHFSRFAVAVILAVARLSLQGGSYETILRHRRTIPMAAAIWILLSSRPARATCCEYVDEVIPGSCQYVPGYIVGGTNGSALLINATGGDFRKLMDNLRQTYTHSGMITSWPYTITHDDMVIPASGNNVGPNYVSLGVAFIIGGPAGVLLDWLFGGGISIGYGSVWFDPAGLYNGQPGLITQDVSNGDSQTFQGGPVQVINPAAGYAADINQYVWNMRYMGNPVYRQHAFLDLDGEWNKPVGSQGTCYDTCYDSCFDNNYGWYACNFYSCNPHDCIPDPQGSMCSGMVARATNTSSAKQYYSQPDIALAAQGLFSSVRQRAHDVIASQVPAGTSDSGIWDAATGAADQVVNCFTYGDVWGPGQCAAPASSNRSSWQWGTSPSGWYPAGIYNISPDDLYRGHSGGDGALQVNGRYTAGIQQASIVHDYTQCQYRTVQRCHPGNCF